MYRKFTGVIPAFVSPLREDNTVCREEVRRLLDFELSQGADGFYLCGATGEGLVMQPEARTDLVQTAVGHLHGRVPVIAHVAAIDLETTLRLAREAEAAGADAVASIPPIYFAYGEDDIFAYYRKIAEAVGIPVMIYYHPAAGVDLSARFMSRLFEIDNVTAVKWSKPDYFQMLLCRDLTHGEMNIINGPDETLLCGLSMGADGGIGTTYNFQLPVIRKIYDSFRAGDLEAARAAQIQADRVISALRGKPTIPAAKLIMTWLGFNVGCATSPMHRFSEEEASAMAEALREAGLAF